MHGVFILSLICNFGFAALASSSTVLHKYRDSKISRIQPYNSENIAPSSNFPRDERDTLSISQPSGVFLEKIHTQKKIGYESKKKGLSNHEMLKSLGLSKVKPLPGHHRKRLAIESSRHHSRPDDSHMFIIKLPPNPYYYANTNTAHHDNGIEDKNQKIASMGFKSNGKPGRIYHWNLPVLKKMLTHSENIGRKTSNLRHSNEVSDLIDIKDIPTWSNSWDDGNDTLEKALISKQHRDSGGDSIQTANTIQLNGIDDDLNLKLLKKKSPTFYTLSKQKIKAAQTDQKAVPNKYFPGNGKPKGFYVMHKNPHKQYYQKLIAQ